jgi:hypothetical protein
MPGASLSGSSGHSSAIGTPDSAEHTAASQLETPSLASSDAVTSGTSGTDASNSGTASSSGSELPVVVSTTSSDCGGLSKTSAVHAMEVINASTAATKHRLDATMRNLVPSVRLSQRDQLLNQTHKHASQLQR